MDRLVNVLRLTRFRVYPYFLFHFIPFFAVLASYGRVDGCWMFLLVLPFIPAIALGYVFNNICDAGIDDESKNPVSAGLFNKRGLSLLTLFFLASAAASFMLLYSSTAARIMFASYLLLWFLYSGLMRIKESCFGPVASTLLLTVGGPLILVTEFGFFNPLTLPLLTAVFFMGMVIEASHTLHDFDSDMASNTRTFSVRLGRRRAEAATVFLASLSYLFLFTASLYSGGILSNICFLTVYAVAAVALLTINYMNRGGRGTPFVSLTRFYSIYIILFTLVHLNLSTPALIIVLWIISFMGLRTPD